MATYPLTEAAQRAGIDVAELSRLVELGIITPSDGDRFTSGAIRRVGMVRNLTAAGIPLDGLGEAIRGGQVSLDFLDESAYERFSALSGVTFAELAERTGVPVQLADADPRGRRLGAAAAQTTRSATRSCRTPRSWRHRSRPASTQPPASGCSGSRATACVAWRRPRRHGGDPRSSCRRWRPASRPDEILGVEFANRMTLLAEQAILGMYHLQQAQAWTGTIIDGLEMQLAAAGLHSRLEHPPAMCFLDITGYTRLTQERGDAAAAGLAEQARRGSCSGPRCKHGGRPVKWLGDGVMLFFPDPGPGVVAALEMVAGVADAGLPPAHVGLHAGPVIFQEGDYYGQTVNVASRIADYARPGEVLVSQEVVDASGGAEVTFREIGPVELKGVSGAVRLHAAALPG